MSPGDLVKLKEEAIISLNLDETRDHLGILLTEDVWNYTEDNSTDAVYSIVWKVFIENQIYELHNFSLDKIK